MSVSDKEFAELLAANAALSAAVAVLISNLKTSRHEMREILLAGLPHYDIAPEILRFLHSKYREQVDQLVSLLPENPPLEDS